MVLSTQQYTADVYKQNQSRGCSLSIIMFRCFEIITSVFGRQLNKVIFYGESCSCAVECVMIMVEVGLVVVLAGEE